MSSTNKQQLNGILTVLQTPFTEQLNLDHGTLHAGIDWVFKTGAHGVVVAMVSEILRLGYHQRRELAAEVCEAVDGRGFTVISAGAESTPEAVEFARHAEELGASAVMAIPPVATRLDSAQTLSYFQSIAHSVSIPLVVQDASSYVGGSIDLRVYQSLLDQFGFERILFKPEASPLGPNLSKLRDATDGAARIFEGSGGISLVDCHRRGIVGTMPGMELLDGIVELWNALESGDEDRIYELSLPICAIVTLQIQAGLDGFLAVEKYLLHKRGLYPNTIRVQPNAWELDDETRQEVDRLFARFLSVV
ncbi:MAG: dihydrodipicolinate synthase family protein [Fuerstiella sp.]|nr:dihydrodipicolinate synthase family protein [Fuerstiella sp.]